MKETISELELSEDDSDEFSSLGQLKAEAPDTVWGRLHRRLQMAQLGKDLAERQAFAFWIVIDAFLKLFFAPRRTQTVSSQDEKNESNQEQ